MWKRLENWIENNEWWLLAAIAAILLRVPSLLEPYWYGDEGIYLTIGRALNMGIKLYSQIHDNKPPLLYLMAAMAGGEQFWFKFEALVTNVLTVWIFSKLTDKVFGQELIAKQASLWVFVLITCLPFWEGNIANAENFFLLSTITAVWLLWETKEIKKVFLAGLVLGIGGLFKVPAILEAGVWPLLWLRLGSGWWKRTIALGIGLFIPIVMSWAYYYGLGSGNDYLKAAWVQNLPYLSSWKPVNHPTGIYSLTVRAGVTITLIATLLGLMKKLGKRAVTVGIWGLITLFAALLSSRPYPHYLLQVAGSFSLGFGLLQLKRNKEKVITFSLICLLLIAWISFKFTTYPTASYYTNFLKWTWGKETTQQYRAYFSDSLKELYLVSSHIKSNSKSNDKIFVWGDVPMIYALSERIPATKYMVEYHIRDFNGEELTIEQIKYSPPKFIVIVSKGDVLPELKSFLQNNYYMEMRTTRFDVYKWGQL